MGACRSSLNVNGATTPAANAPSNSNSTRITSTHFPTLISNLTSAAASASLSEARTLHQIPGRMFSNGANRVATLYTQQGRKGVNQDAMLVWENFGGGRHQNSIFCGVFDGHGPYGHMVAKRVRDVLPILLRLQWDIKLQNGQTFLHDHANFIGLGRLHGAIYDDIDDDNGDDSCESTESEANEVVPRMHVVLKRAMLKASKLMDRELKSQNTVNCLCSGTTAVMMIVEGQDLIIGNVGDSRAVLATRDSNNDLAATQLTVDLKPDLPREAARILKCKGRVFSLRDEPEVARLWLPYSNSPGLAMARAFGDFCLKGFGLISSPDVKYHRITDRDEFVILATDGVWDVLSNKEAVDIVASAPNRETASKAVIDCATRAWGRKYPTSKIDDCAVICLFLDQVSQPDAPEAQNNPESPLNPNTDTLHVPNPGLPLPQSSSGTAKDTDEIVLLAAEEPKIPTSRPLSESRRSLAECLTGDDEEWSALEGISRVNSLINLPRLMPALKRSKSQRKWL